MKITRLEVGDASNLIIVELDEYLETEISLEEARKHRVGDDVEIALVSKTTKKRKKS